MTRIVFAIFFLIFGSMLCFSPQAYAQEKEKSWALYTWINEDDQWSYSLVRDSEKHPDGTEVKEASTHKLETIKTRISLLERGSTVSVNPLPVLNMELHKPPGNTLKELQRTCDSAQLKLVF